MKEVPLKLPSRTFKKDKSVAGENSPIPVWGKNSAVPWILPQEVGPPPLLLHKFSFAFVTGRRGRSPRIAVNPKNSLCSFSGTPAARHKSASRIYSVPRPLRDSKNPCPEVSAAFFKPRSQTLKPNPFASCCAERKRSAHKDALQGSKGH